MKRLFLFFFTLTILVTACDTYAGEPFNILKEKIDQVFSILNDPVYSDETKKDEQREILWKTIENAFDFNVMSRLTLANYWKSFSSEQQDEFSRVFGRFLSNTYLDKIQSGLSLPQPSSPTVCLHPHILPVHLKNLSVFCPDRCYPEICRTPWRIHPAVQQ